MIMMMMMTALMVVVVIASSGFLWVLFQTLCVAPKHCHFVNILYFSNPGF
jgi:hypothetical protein